MVLGAIAGYDYDSYYICPPGMVVLFGEEEHYFLSRERQTKARYIRVGHSDQQTNMAVGIYKPLTAPQQRRKHFKLL